MTLIIVTMLAVVAVAVLALAYAAFPQRGESMPGLPWLGDALGRAVDSLPILGDGDLDPHLDPHLDTDVEPTREQQPTSR